MKKGDSLFIYGRSPNGKRVRHLYTLITNPDKANRAVMVSFTTPGHTQPADDTCYVAAGAHPRLTIPQSQLAYNHAAIIDCVKITKLVNESQAVFQEPMPDEIVKQIREGFFKTPNLPQEQAAQIPKFLSENP